MVEIKNYELFAKKNIVLKGAYTLLMKMENKLEEQFYNSEFLFSILINLEYLKLKYQKHYTTL